MVFSFLMSCGSIQGGAHSDSAEPAESGPFSTPATTSAPWLTAVRERIAGSARAIVPETEGFVAAMPGHAAIARFSSQGLTLGETAQDTPLRLRFVAWGVEGNERHVAPVPPQLGDCITDVLPEGGCARQLEYAYNGVTAWWVGQDRGVEFGWTVAEPVSADGDTALAFWVEVDGADWVEAAGDGAELIDTAGTTWAVSGALAWGADGAALPAWLEVNGYALVVRVEVAGAVYPVMVDPVLSAATTTLTGGAAGDQLGTSVSGAGDVNGDGFDDVIVGAPYFDSGSFGNSGAAYIHHGASSGVSSSASRTLTGGAAGDLFGYSVFRAGDVNGDGYDDVIVGAPYFDSAALSNSGAAYVYHGSASGVSSSASRTLTGSAATDYFGYSVSSAGDVNDDGYDDVIIGAWGYNRGSLSDAGAAYIHHGSSSGVLSIASRTLSGGDAGDYFGRSVSGAGDVNGDGFHDVIIGASYRNSGSLQDAGAAYIHHGGSSGVSSGASRTLTGGAGFDFFGTSVSGAGDVNNDGYDDVIIGAYGYNSGSLQDAGAAHIFRGSPSGVSSSASSTLTGSAADDYLGESVSGAGDVNGDGYDDVIIGAMGCESALLDDVGAAYIHHGSSSGVSSSASRTLTGSVAYDYLGGSVSGAGDVNSDGYDDVLIGATGYNSGSSGNTGAAFIHHGYTDADGDGVYSGGDASTTQDCDDGDASVGGPSTFYLDDDGDGYGGSTSTAFCTRPSGYTLTSTDCDDSRAAVNPGALEVCDALNDDEDCDGLRDNSDPNASTSTMTPFYRDSDGDGYGSGVSRKFCDLPTGYSGSDTDCDDADASVNPAGSEICDALDIDEDCDGLADDADPSTLEDGKVERFADEDGDGHGGSTRLLRCDPGPQTAEAPTDCDDSNADVSPDGAEVCDETNTDEDCDGLVNDADPTVDRRTTSEFFFDEDGDGFGNVATPTPSYCDPPRGAVTDGTDCDDSRADVSPDAAEVPLDGIDQDCDGLDATSRDGGSAAVSYGDCVEVDGMLLGNNCSETEPAGCASSSRLPSAMAPLLAIVGALGWQRRRAGCRR
jgi:hypothetical protein